MGGIIIASPNGCFSHVRLQHLIRIVENRAGFISIPLFVKDPGFPPTLAHGESLQNAQLYVPVDVRAALAIVFGSHSVLCFFEYPVPFQLSVPLHV